MSVIIGRALPDVRDGLKPVHRRILYAMQTRGCSTTGKYKKCAGVVGDVLEKYHPHGDAAIYDALVRMAQPWNLRYLLVDGQGNFGSRRRRLGRRLALHRVPDDASSPRSCSPTSTRRPSTSARTSTTRTEEPLVLPARFPNLLVNGSLGHRGGHGHQHPAAQHGRGDRRAPSTSSSNPKATVRELMELIPGPDFPTGGFIHGREGIRPGLRDRPRAHHGAGAARDRGPPPRTERETIVVTEIPYQVNKARLIEQIAELVRDKKLEGISDIRDESDRDGMRIVIELKRDAMAEVVLNNLFANTPLQTTFGIIMLAIDDGQPRTLNLKEMLERFVAHRREVVTRRSRFELRKAEAPACTWSRACWSRRTSSTRSSPSSAARRDPDEARWGLMHVLSPSLYEHERFQRAPAPRPGRGEGPDGAAGRPRPGGEEPKSAGLHAPLRGRRLHRGAGQDHPRDAAAAAHRPRARGAVHRADRADPGDRAAAGHPGERVTLLDVIKDELREIREKFGDERRTEISARQTTSPART